MAAELTASDIQSIIATLERAAASGVSSARDGDMSFQWRSADELQSLITYWRRRLSEVSGTKPMGSSVVYFERS